ncbi:oxidoreductase [Actinorhabdospora filicis]|uniref:Oxidoreductase n=1 Tax=Actinorhabdospora filicis TaxID=1785913 RepID=A0A9W6W676_9ACTN|nr:SDR family oxidoreductase [Actinorhabdospora filicis]GLZ81232.1 oxidoreductase [Actinorhabdospora filicis]
MTRFENRIALITGGTSGMGYDTARRLLDEGAQVVITGRSQDRVDAAVASLGPGASGLAADTARLDDVGRLMAFVAETHGRLDVLFANAGVAGFAPAAEVTEADYDRVMDVNLKGLFFTVQAALPLLTDGASVVLNASWTASRGLAVAPVYSASKAAVRSLARTFAAELAPRGIRVNSISPGYITTPMSDAALDDAGRAAATREVAAGRFGTGEEVAGVVAFLASGDGSYVNAQDVVIDGGLVGVAV